MIDRERYIPVRLGMIGGGGGAFIGSVHRMAALLDGRFRLVCGALSQNFETTLATGAQWAIAEDRLYESWEEMLAGEAAKPADQRMEAVSIVTPNHLHVPVAERAIESGFHVICDKPAGISLAETEGLATRLASHDRIYALTHTYLGYPIVWQARHLVAQHSFGAVRRVMVEYPQGWLASAIEQEGQKQAGWRSDPARAGLAGAMADIGTHAHSLSEFVTGSRMTDVAARLRAHFDHRALDDDGEVSFRMANGATGVLTASQVCVGEENSLAIRVYGERGAIEWHQMEPNTLMEHRAGEPTRAHRAGADKPLCDAALARTRLPSGHPEGFIEAFANIYCDAADAIRTGQPLPAGTPGIDEALRGMAFLEAVVASNQNNGAWTALAARGAAPAREDL